MKASQITYKQLMHTWVGATIDKYPRGVILAPCRINSWRHPTWSLLWIMLCATIFIINNYCTWTGGRAINIRVWQRGSSSRRSNKLLCHHFFWGAGCTSCTITNHVQAKGQIWRVDLDSRKLVVCLFVRRGGGLELLQPWNWALDSWKQYLAPITY